jgi:hypothetical protein
MVISLFAVLVQNTALSDGSHTGEVASSRPSEKSQTAPDENDRAFARAQDEFAAQFVAGKRFKFYKKMFEKGDGENGPV